MNTFVNCESQRSTINYHVSDIRKALTKLGHKRETQEASDGPLYALCADFCWHTGGPSTVEFFEL